VSDFGAECVAVVTLTEEDDAFDVAECAFVIVDMILSPHVVVVCFCLMYWDYHLHNSLSHSSLLSLWVLILSVNPQYPI
jgi:hypothetical protein